MSLYNKYRPETFDSMIGNEEQIKVLQKFILDKNRPHVYLFSGPSGCGKTTAARIMAKEIGATDLSIKEINSSNNRGIDTAREIADQMRYGSLDGKPVIYILDEIHRATLDFSNAMLKYLEDTPSNVYFFLCTTDPNKLLTALKNRCTEIKFNSLKPDQLILLLRKVNKKEEANISLEAIEAIAEKAQGSPRAALVLFEKIIGIDESEQLGIIESDSGEDVSKETLDFCRVLLNSNNWKEIADCLKLVPMDNPESIRYAVLGYMNAVLLKGKNDRAGLAMEMFSENTFNTGKVGITLAAYQTLFAGK